MELVEKTELLRRFSAYALSKTHLDRYRSFRKILLILSWDINLNPGPVHGIHNENLLHVLPFRNCSFSGDGFYYNLNIHSKNVSRNEWDVFNSLSANFTKWSNTRKQFVACSRRIVWVCLTVLRDWRLKG